MVNPIEDLLAKQSLALGTIMNIYSPEALKAYAEAGLDFVRISYPLSDHRFIIHDLVDEATSLGLIAWVRCDGKADDIQELIDTGASALTIEQVESANTAKSVVEIAETTYDGGKTSRGKNGIIQDYLYLSCQIESQEGFKAAGEIIGVEGVHCFMSGRRDLAESLGLSGQMEHPKVREIERQTVKMALDAGKDFSIHELLTESGLDNIKKWREIGVRIFTIDISRRVLKRAYSVAVSRIRGT
jgi:4-hydroxy-2-oxoheptanedioate aldolase